MIDVCRTRYKVVVVVLVVVVLVVVGALRCVALRWMIDAVRRWMGCQERDMIEKGISR
jgi:hypothetical protein